MQNKHQNHPEDEILTGDLSAIDLLYNFTHASVKMDGIAIVWGKDPATGTFFVGNKAVFNKKKIRIAHSHEEIDFFYDDEMAEILHLAYNFLPRTDRIFQGDFLGWGAGTIFTQNTITYEFPEVVTQKFIVAPHTEYFAENDLRDAVASPLKEHFDDNQKVMWVQPCVDWMRSPETPQIDTTDVNFLDKRTADCCKKIINAFIREGKELTYELLTVIFDCPKLAGLYLTVIEMKEDLMDSLKITNCPKSFIGALQIKQEGFTIADESGQVVKLVDREIFSMNNFNMPKRWQTPGR
jgi:hypothetical protein